MTLRDRLVDPNSPERRPRKAAYVLPTMFTAGNIYLGYIAILHCFEGVMRAGSGGAGGSERFAQAAIAIIAAVFLDGLDGRIARMTNTTSDFGREMDSLADVISFGLAPAVLAFAWGVQFIEPVLSEKVRGQIFNAAYFVAFLFLLCGACRLARFNVQVNPIPKNPGRPDRKYFVGLPIPAGAALIAAVVWACDGQPLNWWPLSIAWLCLLALLGFLMVSTWRYYSFKGISFSKAYSPLIVILVGAFIFVVRNYAEHVFLALSAAYVLSGIVIRLAGLLRRRLRPAPPTPEIKIA
ncbi:MAG: CDP-diacylglycerol--serine O-phosphatidyltransferase [Candidatus Solibacter sp.]